MVELEAMVGMGLLPALGRPAAEEGEAGAEVVLLISFTTLLRGLRL